MALLQRNVCLAVYFALSFALAMPATSTAATVVKPLASAKSLVAAAATSATSPIWHKQETENLRVLSFGRPLSPEAVAACEDVRSQLCRRWLTDAVDCWQPKCDIVLHSTEKGYLSEVGASGRNTLASSLVTRAEGRIASRRIDVLATRADWRTAALPHELTHVILADVLAEYKIPRWLDEGLAILADPEEKQFRHSLDLHQALKVGAEFRLVELLVLDDYPAAHRWGTFYGQSASVVGFLVGRDRPARLLEFVGIAQQRGYEAALRDVYKIASVREFERLWIADAKKLNLNAKQAARSRDVRLAKHAETFARPASWNPLEQLPAR